MRALRVVGITEGGDVVLEDSGRRERFTVPADEQLRAAARGDLTRLGQIAIELESQLRPREIQARIRAGASVEQVASAAGVPHQKIERFAYPVLLERLRTAEVAQRAHPVRSDGPDSRSLGDVVAHTFGLRGQEYTEAEWDSWKGEDGKWVVSLYWRAGRSDNRAHWTFHPGAHGGTVTAIDEHASDLVEGLPARPLRTVGPVIDIGRTEDPGPAPAPSPPEQLRAAASDTARRAATPDVARSAMERPPTRTQAPETRRPVPPMQRQAPAEPEPQPLPDPALAEHRLATPAEPRPTPPAEYRRPAPGERHSPEPAPAAEQRPAPGSVIGEKPAAGLPAPQQPAPQPPARQQQPTPQPPARQQQPTQPPARQQPAPEAATSEAAASEAAGPEPAPEQAAPDQQPDAAPAANRRTKKGKPVMPSWDEVLLGVRGQR